MNIDIINIVKDYIIKEYPNQYASLLTGSYVKEEQTDYSDVDVIIFVTDRIKKFIETLSYKRVTLQVILISVEEIDSILFDDYVHHRGIYISMIANGKILYDKNNFLENLIRNTKITYEAGGKPLSNEEVNKYRAKITDLLQDIKGEKNIERLFFVVLSLVEELSDFKLRINGHWGFMGKTKLDSLKKNELLFYKELRQSIKLFFEKGDKKGMIELSQKVLDSVGGELLYTSNTYQVTTISGDTVTLRIFNTFRNIERKTFIKQIVRLLECLKVRNFHFVQMKYQQQKEEVVYLIINEKEKIINEILLPQLIEKIPKSDLVDMYSFYPYSAFSSFENYRMLSPFFEFLSKQAIETNNEEFQIRKGIQLLRTIGKVAKMSHYEYKVFMKYLLDCWLMYNYDEIIDNKKFCVADKQQQVLDVYEKIYMSQKNELKKIEKEVDEEIILSKVFSSINYSQIPIYKSFLIDSKIQEIRKKEFSFYKEVLSYCFSVIFIKKHFISYLPYVELKVIRSN